MSSESLSESQFPRNHSFPQLVNNPDVRYSNNNMTQLSSERTLSISSLSTKKIHENHYKYSREQVKNSEQPNKADKSVSNPFHLSMCVNDLESTFVWI